jgi:ABC-type dipeptide/oligopeptide/nickel transport system permease subunit
VTEFFSDLFYELKKNRGALAGLILILVVAIVSLFAPWISPFDPFVVHDQALKIPPIWHDAGVAKFILGTDDLGRDFISRLIYGARVSLGIGFFVVAFTTFFGVILGLLAGAFGSWVDQLIMRTMDILLALPSLLLAIVVVAILGPSLFNAIIAVSIVGLPNVVRVVRASVLMEKEKNYVTASRSFGASKFDIYVRGVLPNCMGPLFVQASFGFSEGILSAAALGFLGLGAQPPTPEWGTMLSDGRAYIESASWLVTLPGVCILVTVLAFNLLGDGLRDALDPKGRKQ